MSVDMIASGPSEATLVRGPSALGTDSQRLFRLTWLLAVTEFRLRFFGSALGYLWQLVQPLLLFGVLYVVFSLLLNFNGDERFYPVALLLGIVLFSFLNEATSGAVRSLVERENLVRKVEFPRLAVPASTVLAALFNLGLNLLPVVLFLLLAGGSVRWSWLDVPFLLVMLTAYALGFAMLLSALFVRYRDVEPIWAVVLQVMFYATPIFYTASLVREKANDTVLAIMMCNPFAAVLQQARHAFVDPSHPSLSDAMGSAWLVAVPVLVAVTMLVVGFWVFARAAPRVAEEL
jgi:ABC-2 type transport system permease protein